MRSFYFRHNLGFTLVEVLVALVVLVIGLIGLASMQLKAMQGAHVSYQRTMATMAAQDMVERLWIEVGRNVTSSGVECPAPQVVFDDWYNTWSEYLASLDDPSVNPPVTNPESAPVDCKYIITIRWGDQRLKEAESTELVYVARLIGDSSS